MNKETPVRLIVDMHMYMYVNTVYMRTLIILTRDGQHGLAGCFAEVVGDLEDVFTRVLRLRVEDDERDDAVVVGDLVTLRLLNGDAVDVPGEAWRWVGSQLHRQSDDTTNSANTALCLQLGWGGIVITLSSLSSKNNYYTCTQRNRCTAVAAATQPHRERV